VSSRAIEHHESPLTRHEGRQPEHASRTEQFAYLDIDAPDSLFEGIFLDLYFTRAIE